MFREDDNLPPVSAQPAIPDSPSDPTPARDPEGVSRDEAFETSRLLVELLHAAHASRRAPETAPAAVTGDDAQEAAPSDHLIRAAIYLYQHGERTVGQLADGLGISRGWASRVAEELVERGHARREGDPEDRRVVRLRLTEGSLAEIERAYRWRGDIVAAALAEHDPAEREAIRHFLRRVTGGLTAGAGENR
jgi:DNA-binding MarR family transcriptional regulator